MAEELEQIPESQSTKSLELINQAEKQIAEQQKKIDFYLTEYSLELLASKMEREEFVVPDYQREFTWEPERKTRFIESLIMGLPIPFLFFWEQEDGKLEIVDGSQRLRTIQEFILGDLELGGMEQLSLLSGFRFTDLSESRQRKIKNRSIRGIVLNEHADEQSRFDLFDRINTGSKNANTAEIRRGVLGGPFMNMVISLAKSELFNSLAPVTKKAEKERGSEELVTRFFAYGDGLDGYKDQVAPFLFTYVKKMNSEFAQNPEVEMEYRDRFNNTMEFVKRTFQDGFRRASKGRTTPRARFEAIAIGSYLALADQPKLDSQDVPVDTSWLAGDKFKEITGADGANAIGRLKGRIYFVRDRLLGVEDE